MLKDILMRSIPDPSLIHPIILDPQDNFKMLDRGPPSPSMPFASPISQIHLVLRFPKLHACDFSPRSGDSSRSQSSPVRETQVIDRAMRHA